MTDVILDIDGLEELQHRFGQADEVYKREVANTMDAALFTIHENVQPYPDYKSDYVRTGTLGRSLGVGQGGGVIGPPDIKEVRTEHGFIVGEFGTTLDYAPYVIGEQTQASHMSHWWTMLAVLNRAKAKIQGLFEDLVEDLARFLDRGR